eukprot:5756082-Amphidinium_carterae.1
MAFAHGFQFPASSTSDLLFDLGLGRSDELVLMWNMGGVRFGSDQSGATKEEKEKEGQIQLRIQVCLPVPSEQAA